MTPEDAADKAPKSGRAAGQLWRTVTRHVDDNPAGGFNAVIVIRVAGVLCVVIALVVSWTIPTPFWSAVGVVSACALSGIFLLRMSTKDLSYQSGMDLAGLALLTPVVPPFALLLIWVFATFAGRWIDLKSVRTTCEASLGAIFSGIGMVLVLYTLFPLMAGFPLNSGEMTLRSPAWAPVFLVSMLVATLLRVIWSVVRVRWILHGSVLDAVMSIGWTRVFLIWALWILVCIPGAMLSLQVDSMFTQVSAPVGQEAMVSLGALAIFGVSGAIRSEGTLRQRGTLVLAVKSPLTDPTREVVVSVVKGWVNRALPGFLVEVFDEGPFSVCRRDYITSSLVTEARPPFRMVVSRSVFQRPFNAGDAAVLDALAMIAAQDLHTLKRVDELADEANTDSLTGLRNYRGFQRTLKILAERMSTETLPAGSARSVALIFIDLDNFKKVNDKYGHNVGNEVLKEMARRIQKIVREPDVVARVGGDEFVVILSGLHSRDEAEIVARRLAAISQDPITADGKSLAVGFSEGIAFSEGSSIDPDYLIRLADRRMYAAKRNREDNTTVAPGVRNPLTNMSTRPTLDLDERAGRLAEAIEVGDLGVVYQPIVDAMAGSVRGIEALVRLGPVAGASLFVPATEIVAVARKSGLIDVLTNVVVEQAIRDFTSLRRSHPQLERLHVNVEAGQILQDSFLKTYDSWAAQLGESRLVLEINESWFQNGEWSSGVELRREVSKHNLLLAVDDLGRERASLRTILDMPINIVKFDKSFMDAFRNPRDTTLVSHLVQICHELNVQAVFEGVETRPQLDFVLDRGGRHIQGYFYSPPLRFDELQDFLMHPLPEEPNRQW